MKRRTSRLLSVLLALCMLLSLLPGTVWAADSAIPEGTPEYNELRIFLDQFHFGWGDRTFDFRNVTDPPTNAYTNWNILQALLSGPCSYAGPTPGMDMFHGETQWNWEGNRIDPLGKWIAYIKTDSAQVEWVLEHVFNCSKTDISNLRASLNSVSRQEYYLDGYYYAEAPQIGDDLLGKR